jgi:hypothetical protein
MGDARLLANLVAGGVRSLCVLWVLGGSVYSQMTSYMLLICPSGFTNHVRCVFKWVIRYLQGDFFINSAILTEAG